MAVFERYGKDPVGDTPMFHFHDDYGRKDILGVAQFMISEKRLPRFFPYFLVWDTHD